MLLLLFQGEFFRWARLGEAQIMAYERDLSGATVVVDQVLAKHPDLVEALESVAGASGNAVYLSHPTQTRIYDVSNPTNPIVVQDLPGGHAVEIADRVIDL